MNDLPHLRNAVFFDGPDQAQKLSRFWLLLVLAACIAATGVVADSTATVIGAMIVAPLMTPILGTMLAVVLGDRRNLIRSVGLVVGGAAAAVLVGYLVGFVSFNPVLAETNAQVSARVTPRLIDLLAAFATGAVGSIALVRRDIGDTLPGVAIAISLVPPLTVVGLTLESGSVVQATGALVLFLANVTAILITGIVVMAIYRVHRLPLAEGQRLNRRNAVLVVVALVVLIVGTLARTSVRIAEDNTRERTVRSATVDWAEPTRWEVMDVVTRTDFVVVRLEGPLPAPDTRPLENELRKRGVDPTDVVLEFIPRDDVRLGVLR